MLTIDRRENLKHPEFAKGLESAKIPVRVETLAEADFAFLNLSKEPIGIERMSVSNYVQKLMDGELEAQLRRCAESYFTTYVLIEGVYTPSKGRLVTHRSTRRGFYPTKTYDRISYNVVVSSLVRLASMGFVLLHTANPDATIYMVEAVYVHHHKREADHTLFAKLRPPKIPVKLSANPAVPKLLALCPRLNEKAAIRLINQYGTIWEILHRPDKELLEIEGFGKIALAKLKESIGIENR